MVPVRIATTSHLAPSAKQYAQRSPNRLILMDGEELTRLLVTSGVAVRGYRSVELKKIDTDYSDTAEVRKRFSVVSLFPKPDDIAAAIIGHLRAALEEIEAVADELAEVVEVQE